MVYGVIKNHGGFVFVESELDKGSEFKIFLPVSGKETISDKKDDTLTVAGQEYILVVDDEEMIRNFLFKILERHSYRVALAKNGIEALEIFKKEHQQIDLILIDVIMPKMGGLDAYTKLQEINPNIKVIFSSGFSDKLDMDKLALNANVSLIQKPFRTQELLNMLQKVFNRNVVSLNSV